MLCSMEFSSNILFTSNDIKCMYSCKLNIINKIIYNITLFHRVNIFVL